MGIGQLGRCDEVPEALAFERGLRAGVGAKLHDDVVQGIFAALLMVDVAGRASSPAELDESLGRTDEILRDVLRAAGRPVYGMLAPFNRPLGAQLGWLVDGMGDHGRVIGPEARYPDEVERPVYAAVQSALLGATGPATVTVGERGGKLVGVVRCAALANGPGLAARLRLEFRLAGGDADVRPRGRGWRVGFWLPV